MSPVSPQLRLQSVYPDNQFRAFNENLISRNYLPTYFENFDFFDEASQSAFLNFLDDHSLPYPADESGEGAMLGNEIARVMNASRCGLAEAHNWLKNALAVSSEYQVEDHKVDSSHWQKETFTYRLNSVPDWHNYDDVILEVRQAFSWWERVSVMSQGKYKLEFKEVTNSTDSVDIEVNFVSEAQHIDTTQNETINFAIVPNESYVLAHGFYPIESLEGQMACDIHCNNHPDIPWTINAHDGYDICTLIAHEIGHVLGLEHNNDEFSIMYRTYLRKAHEVPNIDLARLIGLYNYATGGGEVVYDVISGPGTGGGKSAEMRVPKL